MGNGHRKGIQKMNTFVRFFDLTEVEIAWAFGQESDDWENSAPVRYIEYMGGYYCGAESKTLDEMAIWDNQQLAAIDALPNTDEPRIEQFWKFIGIFANSKVSPLDPILFAEQFKYWRKTEFENGFTFLEVFDGTHYGSWVVGPTIKHFSFTFEHFPLIAANVPDDSGYPIPYREFISKGILPWIANRFEKVTLKWANVGRQLSFVEGLNSLTK